MEEHSWLLLTPQAPSSPSSVRVAIWRRLQSLGAVSVVQGTWVVPARANLEEALRTLLLDLEQQGGSGFLFRSQTLEASMNQRLVVRFQQEREAEYTEFADRCQAFVQEIEKEQQAGKYTFAELEELEQDLSKLTRWLRTIQGRDYFPTVHASQAVTGERAARQLLEAFTRMVYQRAGLPTEPEQDALPEEAEAREASKEGLEHSHEQTHGEKNA